LPRFFPLRNPPLVFFPCPKAFQCSIFLCPSSFPPSLGVEASPAPRVADVTSSPARDLSFFPPLFFLFPPLRLGAGIGFFFSPPPLIVHKRGHLTSAKGHKVLTLENTVLLKHVLFFFSPFPSRRAIKRVRFLRCSHYSLFSSPPFFFFPLLQSTNLFFFFFFLCHQTSETCKQGIPPVRLGSPFLPRVQGGFLFFFALDLGDSDTLFSPSRLGEAN